MVAQASWQSNIEIYARFMPKVKPKQTLHLIQVMQKSKHEGQRFVYSQQQADEFVRAVTLIRALKSPMLAQNRKMVSTLPSAKKDKQSEAFIVGNRG